MTFKVQQRTRLFACQNPLHQGGGRKGLPKSFLNRFTQVSTAVLLMYMHYSVVMACSHIYALNRSLSSVYSVKNLQNIWAC